MEEVLEKQIIDYGNIENLTTEDKRVYRVYCHIAPNGKMYIGQTCQTLKSRTGSNNGSSYSRNPRFINAIRKYGWKNIKHIVLIDGLSKEMADIFEIELIKKYKTIESEYGYNCNLGGQLRAKGRPVYQYDLNGNFIKEYESANEASKAVNTKRRSLSCCLSGKIKSHRGFMWSYEKHDKIAPHSGQIKRNKRYDIAKRPVYQYDFDGNFIKEHENCEQAAKSIGYKTYKNLYACAIGKTKSAGGFQWQFVHYQKMPKYEVKYVYKTVYQYDLNGNYLEQYKSVSVARKELGIDVKNFDKNMKIIDGVMFQHGFYWSYTKYDKIDDDILMRLKYVNRSDSKTIYQYSFSGQLIKAHQSLKCASLYMGRDESCPSISNCCKGKAYTAYGFVWSFSKLSKEEVIDKVYNGYLRKNRKRKAEEYLKENKEN